MPSYLALRNDVPFVRVDDDGYIIEVIHHKDAINVSDEVADSSVAGVPSTIATHSEGTTSGTLSGTESSDVYSYNLTAGVTYTFSLRGTETVASRIRT